MDLWGVDHDTVDVNGCPIQEQLTLTISPSYDLQEAWMSCGPQTWNDLTLDATGMYPINFLSEQGCDSVVTMNFTLNSPEFSVVPLTGCDSVEVNSIWITEVASFDVEETNQFGCDSIVTYDVQLDFSSTVYEQAIACEPYVWNGQTLTATGTYTHQTINEAGCDSVVTMSFEWSEGAEVALVCPDEICLNEPQPMASAEGWEPGLGVDILWQGTDSPDGFESNVSSVTLVVNEPGSVSVSLFVESPGCSEAFEAQYNVVDLPSNALLDAVVVPTTCAGAGDGAVDLLVDDTGFDLTYAWSPLAGDGSALVDVPAGNYEVSVTNAGLCTETFEFEVEEPEMLMVGLLDSVQTTCGYALGSMEVMAFGGTPPYAYTWEDGTEGTALADMAEGAYGVTVLDAMGCVYETSFDMACFEPMLLQPTNSSPQTTTG